MIGLSAKGKFALLLCVLIMAAFATLQILVMIHIIPISHEIVEFGLICLIAFVFPFFIVVNQIISRQKREQINKRGLERILDSSSLVSRTDAKGKITEVNRRFCEVSGYSPQELLGKDHSMLNSGHHPKSFWQDMYRTTVKYKAIWHDTVTNKAKDGHLYVVKSWIMANFNETGELIGFTSVRQDVTGLVETLNDVAKKNTYLEHAAKILRHDMHSGINTYIPRGIKSLERRIDENKQKELKIEAPIKLIKEGLVHTQKVYKGVFEFTNLVREDATLERSSHNIKSILDDYLTSTSYADQVVLDDNLPHLMVNEALFCTGIDNLIRNGLKYNDSPTKKVEIKMLDKDTLVVIDNGRGLTQEEFEELSQPYKRREGQKEKGTGLGLNITVAIFKEHDFVVSAEKLDNGTMMRIKIK